jgi:hypothetical protein
MVTCLEVLFPHDHDGFWVSTANIGFLAALLGSSMPVFDHTVRGWMSQGMTLLWYSIPLRQSFCLVTCQVATAGLALVDPLTEMTWILVEVPSSRRIAHS